MIHRRGRWSFTVAAGRVRDVSLDGEVVLSQVSMVVRDAGWGTVAPQLDDDTGPDGAVLDDIASDGAAPDGRPTVFSGRSVADGVDVSWQVSVEVTEDVLTLRLQARAEADSVTNRTGLVALHPLSWCGREVVLDAVDGSRTTTGYPVEVAPHQPFQGLGTLRQHLADGTACTITFAGEVFETEDQRNWSDASFKTYSRPLATGFPYQLAAGEEVSQSITLTAGPPSSARSEGDVDAGTQGHPPVRLRRRPPVPMPRLGTSLAPAEPLVQDADRHRPGHLRVEVHTADEDGLAELERALGSGSEVLLALLCDDDHTQAALTDLTRLCGRLGRWPTDLWVLSELSQQAVTDVTEPRHLDLVMRALSGWPRRPEVWVGTDHNLAELNRNRLDVGALGADGVVFSMSSQVHDDDARAVLETADSLPAMALTARTGNHTARVGVGPVTLRPRRNIHTTPVLRFDADGATDPRQHTSFAAAWLVCVLAGLATAEVSLATLLEHAGPRGLSGDAARVFADCAAADTVEVWESASGAVVGLAVRGVGWFANRRDHTLEVDVDGHVHRIPGLSALRLTGPLGTES